MMMSDVETEARNAWLAERPYADDNFVAGDLAPLPAYTGCRGCDAGCYECTPPF